MGGRACSSLVSHVCLSRSDQSWKLPRSRCDVMAAMTSLCRVLSWRMSSRTSELPNVVTRRIALRTTQSAMPSSPVSIRLRCRSLSSSSSGAADV